MMKVVTWNVNGIRARHAQLHDLLTAEQPDIVCLQEIKATPEQVPALLAAPDGYAIYWHGGAGGYSGVALMIRHGSFTEPPSFSHPSFDMEQRIVVADVNRLRIASVYVPNGGKDYEAKLRFLDALGAWAHETMQSSRSLLMCGDLNVAREDRDVHPKERKPGQIGTRPDERALLQRLFDAGLVDVGRTLDPENDNLFTYWAPWRNLRQRNIGWRIDYVLAAEHPPSATAGQAAFLAKPSTAVSMREFGTSDHAPVVVTFATSALSADSVGSANSSGS